MMNMTQKVEAQKGIVGKQIMSVAREEEVSPEWLREKIVSGWVVILGACRSTYGLLE